jgi:hypothetical protein
MPPAKPFPQAVQWTLQPTGTFLSFDSGSLQARIYESSGLIELAGDDLAGHRVVTFVRLAPAAVETAGGVLSIGGIAASKTLVNGLELDQRLGAATVKTRLTFIADHVLRFEVVDWGGVTPVFPENHIRA